MKDLQIVFSKSKKYFPIFSWIIQWYTKKPYSHVSRRVSHKDWGEAYYQASEGKVNYEYHTEFNKKHEIVKEYTIQIPDDLEYDIRKECFKDAGKKYATMQNLGIAIVGFLALFNIRATNPWKEGRNCSELLYVHIFKKLHPELEYDPNLIRPDQIEEILEKYYKNTNINN